MKVRGLWYPLRCGHLLLLLWGALHYLPRISRLHPVKNMLIPPYWYQSHFHPHISLRSGLFHLLELSSDNHCSSGWKPEMFVNTAHSKLFQDSKTNDNKSIDESPQLFGVYLHYAALFDPILRQSMKISSHKTYQRHGQCSGQCCYSQLEGR